MPEWAGVCCTNWECFEKRQTGLALDAGWPDREAIRSLPPWGGGGQTGVRSIHEIFIIFAVKY
jgi:hypothetical protein